MYARVGDSGTKTTFHFGSACGATVYYGMEGHPDVVGISVGAFAGPSFPVPVGWVYEERDALWVTVPPDTEHLP